MGLDSQANLKARVFSGRSKRPKPADGNQQIAKKYAEWSVPYTASPRPWLGEPSAGVQGRAAEDRDPAAESGRRDPRRGQTGAPW